MIIIIILIIKLPHQRFCVLYQNCDFVVCKIFNVFVKRNSLNVFESLKKYWKDSDFKFSSQTEIFVPHPCIYMPN